MNWEVKVRPVWAWVWPFGLAWATWKLLQPSSLSGMWQKMILRISTLLLSTHARLWNSLGHLQALSQSREPERKMSIVPVSDQGIIANTPSSSEIWGPFQNLLEEFPLSIDLWGPFSDFPSLSRGILPIRQTQINWSETPRAHVFKAYFPGLTGDQVIVFVDEDRMLQISTDDGKFMSRFKLPDNAITDQVKASMNYGLLTVTVSKEMSLQPQNVRVVEITGSD